MTAPTFEGSYLGADAKISDQAIMECKICWTPYDPAEGDETRSILPGTPFRALPSDWKCPNCDAPKEQFMVREDPAAGLQAAQVGAVATPRHSEGEGVSERGAGRDDWLSGKVAALVAEFREIHASRMRDVPFTNKALHVEAVGFRLWEGHGLGVLITPWMMSLVLLPGPEDDWDGHATGESSVMRFPSGEYEFIHACRPALGAYKSCSLFSPMGEFAAQLQAKEVARAVMVELFNPANREETDRRAEIRQAAEAWQEARRELEEAAAELAIPAAPSRRKVITGGLAEE